MDSSFRPLLLSWLLGLLAGAGLGLFLAWYVLPVTYTEAQPYDLNATAKDDYLRMIASSYTLDNAFDVANRRLYYLQLPDAKARITQLAQIEPNPKTQQALTKLRIALNNPVAANALPSATVRPTRDLTPAPRITVIVVVPTAPPPTPVPVTLAPTPIPPTSEPNPNAPHFQLAEKRALDCGSTGGGGVIQVEVQDGAGKGVPGILVEVNSASGNEQFFTGFKPERGPGFGDVSVPPGTYSVHLVDTADSDVVGDLLVDANVVECGSNPAGTQGWYLVFQSK